MEHIVAGIVITGAVLSALLLGWRQVKQRQWLRANDVALSPEDRSYHVWSIRRRILGCVLLLGLAAMILGLYALNISSGLEELMSRGEQARGTGAKLTDEQREFVYGSMRYVGALMIVLLALFVVAAWDIVAIRRYGQRHRRRIREDRRAMLERQLPILYAERRARREASRDAGDTLPDIEAI
jgi:cell division protein FtsL